jgi:hypothetical protein
LESTGSTGWDEKEFHVVFFCSSNNPLSPVTGLYIQNDGVWFAMGDLSI